MQKYVKWIYIIALMWQPEKSQVLTPHSFWPNQKWNVMFLDG